MMSPREREVVKVLNIQTLIQVLGFAGFYLPFFYNWVWLLAPIHTSLIYSLLIGVSVIGLLYVPWKQSTARLRRLRKYGILFSRFYEAMITDMEANDAEKGDTWLTEDLEELNDRLDQKWEDIVVPLKDPKQDRQTELVKLSNYCAMLYLRKQIDKDLRIKAYEDHRKINEAIAE